MIIIKVIGLDQFIVGRISKDVSKSVANLYEVDLDDVNFVAPNCMIFHNGVEQTSWHVIIDVNAPKKVEVLQSEMAKLLIKTFKDVAINVEVLFHYYSVDNHYIDINLDYPRYISESNIVGIQENDEEESEIDEQEIFSGNIFERVFKEDDK